MRAREFARTGRAVSEVGLGCWQIGCRDWPDIDETVALRILHRAYDAGIRFFDTADIYGDGHSESLVGKFLSEIHDERPFVATKLGQASEPGGDANYRLDTMRDHATGSLQRIGGDALDLIQLHCIPVEQLRSGEVFSHLQTLRSEGLILSYGASVESMEEAELCLADPEISSLQIIFNIFRQKPIDILFERAQEKNLSLIIRLPLASGLLAGKFTKETVFAEDDHRNFNRDGQAFNVGETFAGLAFEKGLGLVEELRELLPVDMTMAQAAQRWILDHEAVTTIITGASRPEQAAENASVSDLPPLPPSLHERLSRFYQGHVQPHIRGPY
ncbi:MAG: aldo/keto reductase [Planctomycetota bacterium]|nr:aldo/keto reductase [Planctomycetota bacterium]